jgi:MarR family transcriptional regulator, organic hydroperoxide resistance regulator
VNAQQGEQAPPDSLETLQDSTEALRGTDEGVGEGDLNQQIMDAVVELIKSASSLGQQIGADFGLTGSDAMALHKIDVPISMKELGARMGCDASFVTVITDALEKHGLARREPSLRDRRSKNVVLTEQGVSVREQITKEVSARMPWANALDLSERKCFLALVRKMLRSRAGG